MADYKFKPSKDEPPWGRSSVEAALDPGEQIEAVDSTGEASSQAATTRSLVPSS